MVSDAHERREALQPGIAVSRRTIRLLPFLTVLAAAASVPAPATAATNEVVIQWIKAASHPLTMTDPDGPLDDLAPLSAMVGRAEVVGLGEATHGSHEIWRVKQRMVQYLVRRLGFTAFVMETTAPIGRELDEYVLNDVGDPRTILSSFPWSCPEVVDVFVWMRTYNADRRHQWKLRVAGMELGLTTEDVDQVTGDVATAAPDLVPVIRQAYAELRAAPRVTPVDRAAYSALPQAT
jgi:erythromycin esterase